MIIEDKCLGLVRSLGLAESHSVNWRLGGRSRLKAHARDTAAKSLNAIHLLPRKRRSLEELFIIFGN